MTCYIEMPSAKNSIKITELLTKSINSLSNTYLSFEKSNDSMAQRLVKFLSEFAPYSIENRIYYNTRLNLVL